MNEHELRRLMYTAQQENMGPFVIRYPRDRGVLDDWQCPLEAVPVGKGRKQRDGNDVAVLSLGPIGNDVEEAISDLSSAASQDSNAKSRTPSIAHYDMRFLKPLDEDILQEVGKKFSRIVTIEDGVRNGGLGSAVMEWLNDHGYHPQITRMGLPDNFVEHGSINELREIVGLDINSIKQAINGINPKSQI